MSVPRRLARWLLEHLLPRDFRDHILGDLAESRRPTRDYWREVLRTPLTWLAPRPIPPASSGARDHGNHAFGFLLADLRYAWRTMLRQKALAFVAVGTLALGIGASTAIFSVVHPILVGALPYPDPDRLMILRERDANGDLSNLGYATFDDIARGSRSFEHLAALRSWRVTMTTVGEPRPFTGQRVSPDYFRTLGVTPTMGRDFVSDDDIRGTPHVIILSNGTWRDAFGADPEIIGRAITLDGETYAVIGVMPVSFENVLAPEAQVWAPLRYTPTLPWACRTCRHLRVIARRHTGASAEQASREVDGIAARAFREHQTEYAGGGIVVRSLARDLTEGVRPALIALLGAVLILLLVACLNVSNLLLARGLSRRGEFALRLALGADRGRIVRQLLTESVMLALMGGFAGIGLAILGVKGLVALSPPTLPRLSAIAVDGNALAFALVLTSVVGLVFGLVPAWQASGTQPQEGVRHGARNVVRSDRFTRSVVVVSEVSLALVLLVGSGLLLRSMREVLAVDPGFEPAGVLTMQVQAGAGALQNDSLVQRFYAEALSVVRQVPGVVAAAWTSQLPLSGDFDGYGVHLESRPRDNPSDDPGAFRYAVSDGYFEAMQIPLVRGRYFAPSDDEHSVPVVIINAAFAAQHLQGLDPIGERVRVGGSEGPWREIVGIVGDVDQISLEATQSDAIYLPETQWRSVDYQRSLVARGPGDVARLAPVLRAAIWSVDKDQPILRVATADALVEATTSERRFAMVMFEAFALVALLLAAAGIYGVLIGSVAERTRELGVRAAFGATAADLIWLVVREGMTMTLVGVLAGLALAVATSRAITGLLYGVAAVDPTTYIIVTASLVLVALLACWVPAFRASRVDPIETLRQS